MAMQQNSFALLSDDESDDFSSLLARAAATKVDAVPPAEKNQNQQKQKNEIRHESDNRNDSVTIPTEKGRGRGFRGRGRGMRRYASGGNGFDGGQLNRDGAGYDNYQQDSDAPNDQYPSVESEQGNFYGRNYGPDSVRSNYRGRGRGRFGGRGRAYGRGRGFYGNQGPRFDNEDTEGNPNGNQVDEGDGGGWEQVKDFNSKDYRARRENAPDNERNDRNYVDRRGYGRGRGYYGNQGPRYDNEDAGVNPNENRVDEGDGGGWEQVKDFNSKDYRARHEDAPDNERNDRNYVDRRGYSGGYRAREGRDRRSYVRNETPNTSDGKNEAEGEVVLTGNAENVITNTEMVTAEPAENGTNVVIEDGKVENVAGGSEKKQAEEEAVNEMTLEEYEKVLAEKRKPLEALKTVERKVVADKDFESMQLVEKKKEDSVQLKLKTEKEKLRKKESTDKEDKTRKSLSINEFLKPAGGGTFPRGGGRGRGARGRGRGDHSARDEQFDVKMLPTFHIEDPGQFPVLGGAVKA